MPDDMKDLTRLLQTFQDQDGSINPDKAPPDMKVTSSLCRADNTCNLCSRSTPEFNVMFCRTSSKGCRLCSKVPGRHVLPRRQSLSYLSQGEPSQANAASSVLVQVSTLCAWRYLPCSTCYMLPPIAACRFVVKTVDSEGRKVFINMCGSPQVAPPGDWQQGQVQAAFVL